MVIFRRSPGDDASPHLRGAATPVARPRLPAVMDGGGRGGPDASGSDHAPEEDAEGARGGVCTRRKHDIYNPSQRGAG